MNIKDAILAEHSKKQTLKVVNYIGNDAALFAEFMQIYFKGPYRVTQRAAWVLMHCADRQPQLVEPHLKAMVEFMNEAVSDSVKRNTLRILQFIEIPKKLQGALINRCFDYLISENEAIAVRVFSITVLYNIVKKEPELKNELRLVLEGILPFGSAGLKSRAKRTLKLLEKI